MLARMWVVIIFSKMVTANLCRRPRFKIYSANSNHFCNNRSPGLGKEWKCPLKHSHHGSCNHTPNMNQALGIKFLFYQLINNFIKNNIIPYGKKFSHKIFSPPTIDKMLTFAGKKLSRLRKVCIFFFCENFLPRKFLPIIFYTITNVLT